MPSTDGKEMGIAEIAEAWGNVFSGRRTINISPATVALRAVNPLDPTTVRATTRVTVCFTPQKLEWQLKEKVLYLFLLEFYQHH